MKFCTHSIAISNMCIKSQTNSSKLWNLEMSPVGTLNIAQGCSLLVDLFEEHFQFHI